MEDSQESPEVLCKKFTNWLNTALPGERFCYYFGPHVAGHTVARLAFKAYENGKVVLFQRKEGHKFGYWAQCKRRWEG